MTFDGSVPFFLRPIREIPAALFSMHLRVNQYLMYYLFCSFALSSSQSNALLINERYLA